MTLSVARWKYNKHWVYSITYDEALADLRRFVIPLHKKMAIPGHVEVVAGQIGKIRNVPGSSYNGLRHMNAGELQEIVSQGWGVGCHSWSHGVVMKNPDLELRRSKSAIEKAIKKPVTVYTAPGSNDNLPREVQDKIREYGYLAGMSITDDINYPEAEDLLWINRVPLHERYWGPFTSAFDAYKRIHQAKKEQGWIVDYCHCPLEKPIHEYKDCTAVHHRDRLETVMSEGGDDCWYANPDEVVDYRYLRRYLKIECLNEKKGHFVLHLDFLPVSLRNYEITLELRSSFHLKGAVLHAGKKKIKVTPSSSGISHFTVAVYDGMEITVLESF